MAGALAGAMAGPAAGAPPRPRPAQGPAARVAGGLVAALRPLDPAAPWVGAWRDLGERALVANPFYGPDYAFAAAHAAGAGVRLLVVADRLPEEAGARLVAAWPVRVARLRWGLPLPLTMGWSHGHCPLGAPLLDAGAPEAALDALLAAPRALRLPPRLLMPYAPADGPFADLLARTTGRRAAFWPYARAVLDTRGAEPADHLGHMSAKRRRKLRLARERLGPASLESVRAPGALPGALADYVALEAAGWKGRAGTAIAQRPGEGAFLRALVDALGARDRVRIERLRRDGRTLASAILVSQGDEAWFLKIAHDEGEAENGPGVQLVHRLTEGILAGGARLRLDSCAAPGYRLAEMFWTGRRAIAHHLVEAGSDPLFPLALALERAREAVARARARRRGETVPGAG